MSKRSSTVFSKDLDKKKQVSVSQFNGMNLVDIREFYTDKATGELRPGKKGISLSEDAWKVLMESRDEIGAALQGLGGKKARAEPQPEAVAETETGGKGKGNGKDADGKGKGVEVKSEVVSDVE